MIFSETLGNNDLGFILNHIFSNHIIITSTSKIRDDYVCVLKELYL